METKNLRATFKVLIRYRPAFLDFNIFRFWVLFFLFLSESESILPGGQSQCGFKDTWMAEIGDLHKAQTPSSSVASFRTGITTQAEVEGPNPSIKSKWERAYLQLGCCHKY